MTEDDVQAIMDDAAETHLENQHLVHTINKALDIMDIGRIHEGKELLLQAVNRREFVPMSKAERDATSDEQPEADPPSVA